MRVRPFLSSELASGGRRVVSFKDDKLVIVNPSAFDADPDAIAAAAALVHVKEWAHVFRFDHCLWSYDSADPEDDYCDQGGVHSAVGKEIVDSVLSGVSATCFAYGHTASGKSYSLLGRHPGLPLDSALAEATGLAARVFLDILHAAAADGDTKATLSILEVHNEKINDLLAAAGAGRDLRMREHPDSGPYVEGLTKLPVSGAQDLLEALSLGQAARCVAPNHANSASSRSHAVLTLELSSSSCLYGGAAKGPATPSRGTAAAKRGERAFVRCHIVDLAGSEKDVESREHPASSSQGDRTEIKLIRRSLSTLGYILKALGKGALPKALPYRDSALTWLLRDALSGRHLTSVLATISPSSTSYDESLSTLKYAERLCLVGARSFQLGELQLPLAGPSAGDLGRIFQGVGAHKPGSAARLLLQKAIADPQQRLARALGQPAKAPRTPSHAPLQSSAYPAAHTPSRESALGEREPHPSSSRRAGSISSVDDLLIDMADEMRVQLAEAVAELDSTRQERDALFQELQLSKETSQSARKLPLGLAPDRNHDRELQALRELMLQKEETMDYILRDLAEEQKARNQLKASLQTQASEYGSRVELLQKQLDMSTSEVELLKQSEVHALTERSLVMEQLERVRAAALVEKNALRVELERLQAESAKDKVRLEAACGQLEQELRGTRAEHAAEVQALTQGREEEARRVQQELAELADAVAALRTELERSEVECEEMTLANTNYAKESGAAKLYIANLSINLKESYDQFEVLKGQYSLVCDDRDALTAICGQQEQALRVQGQQAETSLRMLQQRSAALLRAGGGGVSVEEVTRMQGSMEELLLREGCHLESEGLDAKRLASMVAALRERLQPQQAEAERPPKQGRAEVDGGALVQLRQQAQASESRAAYWEHVAKQLGRRGDGAAAEQPAGSAPAAPALLAELETARKEVESARAAQRAAEEATRQEVQSLWRAVQELNELDSIKEQAVSSIVADRDRLVAERAELTSAARAMAAENDRLRDELDSIDRNLLEAVKGALPAPEPEPLLNPHPNLSSESQRFSTHRSAPPAPRRSEHVFSELSQPQTQLALRTGYAGYSGSPSAESQLEQEIESQVRQLSSFLDKDRGRATASTEKQRLRRRGARGTPFR